MISPVKWLVGVVLLVSVIGCQAGDEDGETTRLQGRLQVVVSDDFESGQSQRYYSLVREQDPRVALTIPERLRSGEWTSGTRVRVEGTFVEDEDASDERALRVDAIEVLDE